MWGKILCLGVGVGLGVGLAQFVLADDTMPDVVISEVAWAGSTKSASDEWIELENMTGQAIDLSGWQLLIDNPGTDYAISLTGMIPSWGFFLVAKYSETNPNSALEVTVNLNREEEGFGITNSGFSIELTNPEEILVDTVWDIDTPPDFAYRHGATDASSMERLTPITDGVLTSSWQAPSDSVNFKIIEGSTNWGTPGAENSIITDPPTLTTITPATVTQGETLGVESITGTGFSLEPPPAVQLIHGGFALDATTLHVANPELIDQARFTTVSNTELGWWDLTLVNPDGKIATLPDAVEVVAPEPEYDLSSTVRINEIYPHPNTTSNDEFIELYNLGDKAVNLTGWILDDVTTGGSSPYTLDNINIGAKSFLVLYKPQSKLTLNDNGDSVYLIRPDNFVLDQVDYTSAEQGQTLSRFAIGWKWTATPTPNGANVLTGPEDDTPPSEPPLEPDDEPSAPQHQPGELLITELLPNPSGGEEFIELHNPGKTAVDLTDWELKDAAGKKYTIGDFDVTIQAVSLAVQPGQYIVVTQGMSGLALNNSGGETVNLLDPNGVIIASVSYPDKAPAGAAYALVDDSLWTWVSSPTPGQPNVVILSEDMTEPLPEIIVPETLPVTGSPMRRWLGILLTSFALAGVVFWKRRENS
ncbi:TPA: hypothetical protein DHW58_00360 [Patescibacteria group bacterium]|uniref:Non specific extracellular endonuclease cleaving RNA and DNA n=2 Tax=Bacteria division Kazan-3B-28 TaxID=1798534 RepID=A0A0G1X8L9_UNCK3|nr:MAG: Non specific extracellular endonuclease cleaving RNA and DNA [candidate division Kazan bacterium GW2011_GWA1_50_15]KKW25851.1 MAG: Non specific extracellular endonuclease cleaving RNA and DNA [candidate division Kazan bacterium GW2011_GWC1_52_13]KKW27135.1 MAG: Non specific extracellular endonuclease cleaving RNA and DNA [candidate division Kazan bacterium GW2011_GWB1_52_7]HCL47431.1 hypothetical protein [Patescibacteria group bacterium]HCR42423.1 hypothetical protein [Patescibacteria g